STTAVWEVATGWECRLLRNARHWDKAAISTDFSPDNRWLISAHWNGVGLWNQADYREETFFEEDCVAVAFHPDGKSFFTAGRSALKQWPLEFHDGGLTGRLSIGPAIFLAPTKTFDAAIRLTPNGRVLALLEGTRVRVFDTQTRKELHCFEATPRPYSLSV